MHFNHAKMIKYSNRPFVDVEDMNNTIVANWNRKVGEDDTVYCLGDVLWRTGRAADPGGRRLLTSLNGRLHLIRGNHDKDEYLYVDRFEQITDYLKLVLEDRTTLILFHFPIEDWDKGHKGSIHLHGHRHSTKALAADANYRRLDVGVDAWDYTPVSLEEVIECLKDKKDKERLGYMPNIV
jgi:calcineurin-like phosphoesterase family protein